MPSPRSDASVNGSRRTMPGVSATRCHQENWISSPRESSPLRVLPRTMFVSIRNAAARVHVGARTAGDAVGCVEPPELGEHGRLSVLVVVLQQLDAVDRRQGEQRLVGQDSGG